MRTADIPEEEREQLAEFCGDVFKTTLLAGLAIPEILEPGVAMATTFQEVGNMAKDGWQMIEPYIRLDVEKSTNRRRFVATRWKVPTPRKGKKAHLKPIRHQRLINGNDESQSSLRQNKELAGCVLAEWDMLDGSFFVAVTTSSPNRQVLLREICTRAIDEQKALVASLSTQEEKDKYPPIRHVWTMLFFGRDTKVMAYLKNQRNFLTLAEYLNKYDDAKEEYFAPKRDTYIPLDYLKGWQVVCKRIEEATKDEWKRLDREDRLRAAAAAAPLLDED
ncbi:hypothetical protein BT69DRAFT_1288372 [Atractiella rhizophila]|nr:hypothetical protein BT69DRAFT_1288372 [Atractiella rhizophila]